MNSYHRDGKVLIRFIAFAFPPLEGCFRFKDVLQIFSLPDNAPKPEKLLADHPFVIEYSFEEMDTVALREIWTTGLASSSDQSDDQISEAEHHWSKKQEILKVLSVLTRDIITKGKLEQIGFNWDGLGKLGEWFSTPDLPEIPLIDMNTYYNQPNFIGTPFQLSDATTSILGKYFGLGNDEKEAFLSACVLFTQALEAWSISHSLTYIGVVSSLEALIEFEHRGKKVSHCLNPDCGQPIYKVKKKFIEFMMTNGSKNEEFVKHLYNRRSGIGHRGKLLAPDVAGRVMPLAEEMGDTRELGQLSRAARICLVNWLMKRE
jgi:hypothetical protein